VAQSLPTELTVLGLSAHSSLNELAQQAWKHRPRFVCVTGGGDFPPGALPPGTEVLRGEAGIQALASHPDADVVVSAIVGAAGLSGTWAALEAGKPVAVANKETLVLAGPLVTALARRTGGALLPVDSEHSAIFQALRGNHLNEVERLVLTGSGGPFRGRKLHELEEVTVEQALRHPTWTMGRKITIDSATLMNKALEVIEARWLFDIAPPRISVVIHPESVIHSFVEFVDGSVLAQLSPPDMRLPIQHALTYPRRVPGPARRLDWASLSAWRFEQPDTEAFPSLELGFEVARAGGTAGAVLNAANEAAVEAFLDGRMKFNDIPRACRSALDHHDFDPSPTLAALTAADRRARQEIGRWTSRTTPATP
jgi:1-deoxy-D-xylulose-5-phosphate reductoisomerase